MSRDERGLSVSVEAALLLPVLVLFVGLLITLARVAIADQQVEAAAYAGARAASIERSAGAAERSGRAAAEATLRERNVDCRATTVAVQPAVARVAVTCILNLADVSLPFIPGSITVEGERVAPVDPHREG